MFNIPDHPDVESALRTGYPRSHFKPQPRKVDEDWERANRRDEAIISGASTQPPEQAKARHEYTAAMIRELERRDHETHER